MALDPLLQNLRNGLGNDSAECESADDGEPRIRHLESPPDGGNGNPVPDNVRDDRIVVLKLRDRNESEVRKEMLALSSRTSLDSGLIDTEVRKEMLALTARPPADSSLIDSEIRKEVSALSAHSSVDSVLRFTAEGWLRLIIFVGECIVFVRRLSVLRECVIQECHD